MRRPGVLYAALSLCAATPLDAQSSPTDSISLPAFIDSLLEAERELAGSPGAVFLAVRDGRVLYATGSGYADLDRRVAIDPERTVFRVGSISKTLTAIAAMQLVEAGTVDFDRDVNDYLQSLHVPERFGTPITLFNLLTHTAGFEERLFGQHAPRRERWRPLATFLADELTHRVLPPGEIIAYNDYGSALAGLLVEEVSGLPFADYVGERIFAPLGMTHSSFRVESIPPPILEHLAIAYRRGGDGFVPYPYDFIQTPPAAGLVSTAGDMGKLLIALLGDGTRAAGALQPETVRQIRSTAFRNHPLLRGRALGFVVERENGRELLIKNGQATGFTSRLVMVPDADFGMFMAQTRSILEPGGGLNSAARFVGRMTSAVLDYLYPSDTTAPDLPPPIPSSEGPPLSAFVGTYRNVVGSWTGLEALATLMDVVKVRDNGDGTLAIGFGRWVKVAPDAFQWHEGLEAYRAFRLDGDGAPTHLFINAGAYRRLTWYETAAFTTSAFVALTIVALLAFAIAPIARRRRLRRGPDLRPERALQIWRATALSAAGVHVTFAMAFALSFGLVDPQRLFKGVPLTVSATLILPLANLGIVAAAVVAGLLTWRHAQGSRTVRVWYSVVTASMIGALLILNEWNLVGFHY